jgi:23S rRNA (guanine745-N1)-methyltransferase
MQPGYYYPWKSSIAPFNGEDAYLDLLWQHLSPEKGVLDSGCGHGDVALRMAPLCRSVLAYDRVAPYIEIAQAEALMRDIRNVAFLCADSSGEANSGDPRIPASAASFDVLTSRRGPLHWIEDARRVARPGAVLIQLNPMDGPPPEWNQELPEALRLSETAPWPVRSSVERRLLIGGLKLHSCWSFDVPEVFDDPEQLYVRLAWGRAPGEVPTLADVRDVLERIFVHYARSEGLVMRHRRFLWKSIVTLNS